MRRRAAPEGIAAVSVGGAAAAGAGRGRRDALDAIGAGVALQATVLVSGVLAAHILGPEQRGLLALLWIVALALAQLGALGLPAAAVVQLGRARGDRHAVIAVCVRDGIRQAAVVLAVQVTVLALWTSAHGSTTAAAATLLAPPAMLAQVYALAVLQGLGRMRAVQLLRVLPTAVYAAALVLVFAAGGGSLALVAAAWAGGYALAAALSCALAARAAAALPPDRAATDARALRRFGLRAMFGSISPLETFRADQLLVGIVLSPAQLGLYVTALALTNLPRFIAQGLGQAAVARIAPLTDAREIRAALLRHTALALAIALAVAVPLAALAGPLVELFFGARFSDAAPLVPVLLAGTVLVCARRVLADGLRGAGAAGAGSLAELCSYVAVGPALAVGVVAGGAAGVAWALVASAAAGLLALLALGRAHLLPRPLMPVSERPPVARAAE